MTLALLLAVAGSIAYGSADFLGGLTARGAHVLRVVAIAAPASLVVELALWPAIGARFTPAAVGWGAASGVASAAVFALLYRTLAVGPMSVLSPITAVVSAVLPVAVGLAGGETLGGLAVAGVALALVGVVVVSGGGGAEGDRPTRAGLVLAVGAGTAIALQLVFLDRAPDAAGVAPLIVGRAVSSAILLTALAAVRRRLDPARPNLPGTVAAGALDSLANAAFLLAVRDGDLAVVAVIVALYPAATVVLARLVLGERIARLQLGGLVVAAAAVSLLAVG